MEDPVLTLRNSNGAQVATNDNWKDTQQAEIQDTGLAPTRDLDAAILITLSAGTYTVVETGKNDTTGSGICEIYDLNYQTGGAAFTTVSGRGRIDSVVLETGASQNYLVRILGPSLSNSGISPAAADPAFTIYDSPGFGNEIAANDDWQTNNSSAAAVQSSGLAPPNPKEPAIVIAYKGPMVIFNQTKGQSALNVITWVEIHPLPANPVCSGNPSPTPTVTPPPTPTPTPTPTPGNCVQPPAEMVAWWPGDGHPRDIQGQSFEDASLQNGATYASGLVAQAFSLDGTDDFVSAPDATALNFGTGPFSIDLWVNFDTTAGEQVLVEKYIQGATTAAGYTLTKLSDNRIRFAFAAGFVDSSPQSLANGVWYHAAATRDANGGVTLYLNGSPIGTGTNTSNVNSTSSFKIGHRGNPSDTPGSNDTRGFYLDGRVDEVELFSRALSQAEIQSIFNSGGGKCKITSSLANISTRLRVETGDNVLIGGFIITGTQPKKIIVRAIGPSLPLAGKLANPTLELRNSTGALLEANDDWTLSANKQAIIDSTIPPSNSLESAILATLPANGSAYTAIVRGANNGTGIGVVEAYDLDTSANSRLANISTRGLVQTGDNVLIAGTIVVGQASQNVLIRAIAPSLNIPGKLADPTLELRDANGALLETNDDWIDSANKQAIINTTIPPSHDRESAIVRPLPPASYTAIVRGYNNTAGIAVVELYSLN